MASILADSNLVVLTSMALQQAPHSGVAPDGGFA